MFSTAVISDGVAVISNFFVQLSHPLLLQSMFPYKTYKVITSDSSRSIYTYFNKVALENVLWSLKAIVWWSLKQRIALYSAFQ